MTHALTLARAHVALSLGLAGCAGATLPALPTVHYHASPDGPLRVGTARVDITPAPGPSTFGYAFDARATRGVWSRLYCRVFVFESRAGEATAVVPCDLPAMSTTLHRAVAEQLAGVIPAQRINLTATHTHHGPGHYLESEAYGGILSARSPGYDPAMVTFLADRIAHGIRTAAGSLEPAIARWITAPVCNLTRNRSVDAYALNPAHPPGGCPSVDPSRRAVDDELHALELRTPDTHAHLGRLLFVAMHPTVLPTESELFSADVFGAASRSLERAMRIENTVGTCVLSGAGDPLAGIVNTNEGDIVPAWTQHSVDEARRLGDELARAAWYATDPGAPLGGPSLAVDSRYVELDLPNGSAQGEALLCDSPELGAASSHGGADHPTSVDGLLPVGPDRDDARTDCQRPKGELLPLLRPLLLGRGGFPTHVPLSLVRLGDRTVAFVPAELTVHAGWQVRARVASVLGGVALIGGLTNGYLQYVTTREEYQLQRYEGASTLYGPRTAEYLARWFETLAHAMRGDATPGVALGEAPAVDVAYSTDRARLARPTDDDALDVVPARGAFGRCKMLDGPPASVCVWWRDGSPGRVAFTDAPWVSLVDGDTLQPIPVAGDAFEFNNPLPDAWAPHGPSGTDPTAGIDDRGLAFQTRIDDRDAGAWRWITLVRLSPAEDRAARGRSLVVQVADLRSPVFRLDALATCTTAERLRCLAHTH